jgi:putative Mg2+ transporter-C (MgtC) family protein
MNWLFGDWQQLMPKPWANVALALVAVFCGSVVGLERERKDKPAGMLTLALVCLGAAVFTMISNMFVAEGDSSRVAAQVVTGIGFLGAGVILRGSGGITGTTTAATIWAMAAVGMVIGVGLVGAALALSLLVLAILAIVSQIDQRLLGRCQHTDIEVVFDPAGGKGLVKIEEVLDRYLAQGRLTDLRQTTEGLTAAHLTYCHAHRHHREFLGRLAEIPEVKEIRRNHE